MFQHYGENIYKICLSLYKSKGCLLRYLFLFILSLAYLPALACNEHHNITTAYDEEIKQIEKLGAASIELANKEIEIELTSNPIVWLQSENQEFDAYLNQGIAFLHVFHYIDALRSFKMAHKINPCSLYPVTGMILSYLSLPNSIPLAKKLISTSENLVESAAERERLWYDFAVSVFVYKARFNPTDQKFKVPIEAYSDLLIFNQNDIETLTLASDTASFVIHFFPLQKTLLKALEIQPDHIGANHYLTHSKEGMGQSAEALEHAQKFSKQAPFSAHAVHMLAHILPEMGDWSKAKKLFEKANEIHLDWAQRNEVEPTEDWHYLHNLHLLAISQIALGDFEEAHQNLTEICSSTENIHACSHLFSLYNVMGDPDNILAQYEQATAEYFDSNMYPRELTGEIELFKGSAFDELPKQSQELYHLILVNRIIQFDQMTDAASKQELIQDIQRYIQSRFPNKGFDSWSSGLLMALRIVSATARTKDKEMYNAALSSFKEKANEFDFDLYGHIENIKNQEFLFAESKK